MGVLAVRALSVVRDRPVKNRPAVRVEHASSEIKKQPEKKKVQASCLSESIPPGMRLATVKVNEISGVTRSLQKNDRVDVLAVTALKGGTGGMISRLVLQNIPVFGMEGNSPGSGKNIIDSTLRRKKSWAVHLLVTPAQGIVLSSIGSGTRLRLLLRNREDDKILDVSPTIYTSSTGAVNVNYSMSDPASAIRPGMRAVTLKLDSADGICGTLSPGDRVDVIFSCKASRFATKDGNQAVGSVGEIFDVRKSSKILLQNVEVLTTRTALETIVRTNKPVKFVTLSVTPSQAEKLALITDASKTGRIRLVARNPEDTEKVSTGGEILEDMLLKDKRAFRVIQVMRGARIYPMKFYLD